MNFFIKMNQELLNASKVLYMRRTGAYGAENYALMNQFKDWLNLHNLYGDDVVILAIPFDNPNTTKPQNCRYDVCMPILEEKEFPSDEVKMREIDGGSYITFLIRHTEEAVQRAWAEYFRELEKYGYLQDTSRPIIERYAKRLVDNHLCELCIPIL